MTDYFVRLAATMEGEDAADAVLALIDRITEKGMRDWLYRVDDKATGEMVGYFNGWGEQVDTDVVHQATEAIRLAADAETAQLGQEASEDEATEDEPDTTDSDTTDSDDQLVEYAESLNQE